MQPVSTPPIDFPVSDLPPPDVDAEKAQRMERYASAEFTRQLLEHMLEAKKVAILAAQGQCDP